MADPNDGKELESRPPTVADLVNLCRSLNNRGAKYVVIGGMAVIQAGFPFASPELLLRLKNTLREKDKIDRLFLEELLRQD